MEGIFPVIVKTAVILLPQKRREHYQYEWTALMYHCKNKKVPYLKRLSIAFGLIEAAIGIRYYHATHRNTQ
jgi:hypothetical protein